MLAGLGGTLKLWRLLTLRGPVVTLSAEGIRDTRIARNTIPWDHIGGIGVWQHRGQRAMILKIAPDRIAPPGLTRSARWSLASNRSLGIDGVHMATAELKVDFDRLLGLIVACCEAALDETAEANISVAPPSGGARD